MKLRAYTNKKDQCEKENRNTAVRVLSKAGLGAALAVMIPFLSGCNSGATSVDTSGSTASTEASSEAGESSTAAEEAATEAETEVSALTEQLEEGENAIADGGNYYSEGTTQTDKTIDWDSVKSETPDAIAWLYIPDTDIDCAVSTTESDTGAYLDSGNNTTFTDPQTIIHGSTAEGSALEAITQYGDSEFFTSHPDLYLYTEDGQVLSFHVFASYEEADQDLLTTYDCYDYDTFQDYINGIYNTRSMTTNLDTSVQEDVINTWQILTIQASEDGTGNDFILQATLTGTGSTGATMDTTE